MRILTFLLFLFASLSTYAQSVDISEITQKAKKGDAEAQYTLGRYYDKGLEGVIKIDKKEALKWFKKSAIRGNPKAQRYIGEYKELGLGGLEKDARIAREWYEKAAPELKKMAEKGDVEAQYHLGLCYKYGNGITKSTNETLKCFQKAAVQGDADAQFNL